MSTALPLFSSYQKPLTPDRVTRYHEYRRNPTSILSTSLPLEELSPPPARKSFLTHANSRVYPLTVVGREETRKTAVGKKRNSSTSITLQPPSHAATKAPPQCHTSTRHLNLSVDSSISSSIPHLDYRQFRRQHQQRHNNTTPAKKDYGDYAGTEAGVHASKRFYKPQIVKITPRSKIVLHSSIPITLTGPLITAFNSKPKADRDKLFAADTFESPERRSEASPDSSPALTYAGKLSKLQHASAQFMHN